MCVCVRVCGSHPYRCADPESYIRAQPKRTAGYRQIQSNRHNGFFFGRLFLLRYLRHDVSTDVYLHVYCTIYTTISTDVLQKDYTRLVDLHHARSINRELNLCRTIQVFILKWHRIQTMKQHHVLLDFIIRLLA